MYAKTKDSNRLGYHKVAVLGPDPRSECGLDLDRSTFVETIGKMPPPRHGEQRYHRVCRKCRHIYYQRVAESYWRALDPNGDWPLSKRGFVSSVMNQFPNAGLKKTPRKTR